MQATEIYCNRYCNAEQMWPEHTCIEHHELGAKTAL